MNNIKTKILELVETMSGFGKKIVNKYSQ